MAIAAVALMVPGTDELAAALLVSALCGALGAAGLRYGLRRARARVEVGPVGVRIVGPNPRTLRWDEIGSFEVGFHGARYAANPAVGVIAHMVNGDVIEVSALRFDGFVWDNDRHAATAATYCAALNRRLLAAKAEDA